MKTRIKLISVYICLIVLLSFPVSGCDILEEIDHALSTLGRGSREDEAVKPAPTDSPTDGTALFTYTYTTNDPPAYFVDASTSFPIFITFGIKNPDDGSIHNLIGGKGYGRYEAKMAGVEAGNYCYVTYVYVVIYEVSGNFDSKECAFNFYLKAYDESVTKSSGCSIDTPGLDGVLVFLSPGGERLTIKSDLTPLVIKSADGRDIQTFTISNVKIPETLQCGFPKPSE